MPVLHPPADAHGYKEETYRIDSICINVLVHALLHT